MLNIKKDYVISEYSYIFDITNLKSEKNEQIKFF